MHRKQSAIRMFMDTLGERMRYGSIGIMLIFSLCCLNAHAATECNTQLTKQDHYDDLNKTLQCLSYKIQKLEQQISLQKSNIAIPGSVKKATTDNSPSPFRIIYHDDNFHVSLKSCTKKGKIISCILVYQNISDASVRFFISRNTTYLVDDNGERWDYENDTAIGWQGMTEVIQKTHLPTKVTFKAQENTTGTKFSLFINHRLEKGEFKIACNDVFLN